MSLPDFPALPKPSVIAALPTAGPTMPIPWITPYVDAEGLLPQRTVPTGRGPMLACACRLGEGRPLFGRQCPHRQRRAMRLRLCGVCGTPLPVRGPSLFIALDSAADPDGGPDIAVSVEPAVHELCALYSASGCRALLRDPSRLPVAIAERYELRDQVAVGVEPDGSPRYVLAPHGHDRYLLGADYGAPGVLHNHVAVLHPAGARFLSLADWLDRHAPGQDALARAALGAG